MVVEAAREWLVVKVGWWVGVSSAREGDKDTALNTARGV